MAREARARRARPATRGPACRPPATQALGLRFGLGFVGVGIRARACRPPASQAGWGRPVGGPTPRRGSGKRAPRDGRSCHATRAAVGTQREERRVRAAAGREGRK
eukprot:scaffold28784_cov57-Phaeocystis_antarctica.AAC.6